jgi:ParB/RepB/Spo0J family partition protein
LRDISTEIFRPQFHFLEGCPMTKVMKTKSGAYRTTTKTRQEISSELQALIEPFGWKVNSGLVPQLQAAELDAVATWLDDPWTKTPLTVWGLISMPNSHWIKFFKNQNDAMAILSTVFTDRGEFAPDRKDAVARLIDHIGESGHTETRFGSLFVEAAPELRIWFGRKAGKPPDLFGNGAWNAIQALIGVPRIDEAEQSPAAVEKPKSTSRKTGGKPAAKSVTRLSDMIRQDATTTLETVPLSSIVPAAENHRKTFDADKLQELAESIRQHGILQPLLLRCRPDADPPYEIIAGERRYRAAKLAGLEQVPAQIVERDGLLASLAMLEENIRREDLNPIERANAIRTLMETFGLKQAEVGKMIGVSQGQVSNELRLLSLPKTLQMEVASGAIAPTLVRSVLPYTELPNVVETMTAKMIAGDESAQTEESIQSYLRASILESSRSMEFLDQWQPYQDPKPNVRHFENVSKADLKALQVSKVDAVHDWEGQERAFNLELFDELNAGPLAERKAQHAAWKKANKPATQKSKDEPKNDAVYYPKKWAVENAIANKLTELLANAIESSKDKTAVLRVVVTLTAICEGQIADELGEGSFVPHAQARKILDKLSGSVADIHETLRQACVAALRGDTINLTVEEAYCYAAPLGLKLWEHWTVTDDLMAALTDAGRAEFSDKEPGFIPDFLRPFFSLVPDAPANGKVKKSKAA